MSEPTRVRSFIRCYGLFWNANEVDWYPGVGSSVISRRCSSRRSAPRIVETR